LLSRCTTWRSRSNALPRDATSRQTVTPAPFDTSTSRWWRPVEPSIVEAPTATTIEIGSPVTSAGRVLIGIALAMNTFFGLTPWMVLHVIAVESGNLWLELPGAALGVALVWALVRQVWPPFGRNVLRLDDEGWQLESRFGPLRRSAFFEREALRGVAFQSEPSGMRSVDRLLALGTQRLRASDRHPLPRLRLAADVARFTEGRSARARSTAPKPRAVTRTVSDT